MMFFEAVIISDDSDNDNIGIVNEHNCINFLFSVGGYNMSYTCMKNTTLAVYEFAVLLLTHGTFDI